MQAPIQNISVAGYLRLLPRSSCVEIRFSVPRKLRNLPGIIILNHTGNIVQFFGGSQSGNMTAPTTVPYQTSQGTGETEVGVEIDAEIVVKVEG